MWMVSASGDKATLRNVPWNFEGIESMGCGTLCLASGRKNSETYARNVFSSVCVYCFLLILFFCPSISGCNMTLLPFTRTVWISCFGKHSDNNMFKTDACWQEIYPLNSGEFIDPSIPSMDFFSRSPAWQTNDSWRRGCGWKVIWEQCPSFAVVLLREWRPVAFHQDLPWKRIDGIPVVLVMCWIFGFEIMDVCECSRLEFVLWKGVNFHVR